MGDVSVSKYQTAGRTGHLEQRFRLPITSALRTEVLTAPPDVDLASFYDHHLMLSRAVEIPSSTATATSACSPSKPSPTSPAVGWSTHLVREVTDTDWPVGRLTWTIERALRTMDDHAVKSLAVLDTDDHFVGVIGIADVLRLDQILQSTRLALTSTGRDGPASLSAPTG